MVDGRVISVWRMVTWGRGAWRSATRPRKTAQSLEGRGTTDHGLKVDSYDLWIIVSLPIPALSSTRTTRRPVEHRQERKGRRDPPQTLREDLTPAPRRRANVHGRPHPAKEVEFLVKMDELVC